MQLGAGSRVYRRPFEQAEPFGKILREASDELVHPIVVAQGENQQQERTFLFKFAGCQAFELLKLP